MTLFIPWIDNKIDIWHVLDSAIAYYFPFACPNSAL